MDTPAPAPPPLPAMPPPPLPPGSTGVVWRSQEQTDREQLRLLMIFHFVSAFLGLITIGFLVFYYFMLPRMFNDQLLMRSRGGEPLPPMPPEVMAIFGWVLAGFGALLFLKLVFNVLSGWCILRRTARTFSLVVAALNCLAIPFGTILGVFTFIILQRSSVQQLYSDDQFSAGPPGPNV